MAQATVANCVLSIVGSFASGVDVLRKLRVRKNDRRRGSSNNATSTEDDEARLAHSLRYGSDEITREYRRSVLAVGEQFAIGDTAAQSKLAEVLLRLNTGLVGIISSFLSNDRKTRDERLRLDYRRLADVAEMSYHDTCGILRQLAERMISRMRALPALIAPTKAEDPKKAPPIKGAEKGPRRKPRDSNSQPARPKEATLARVVIQDSTKPARIALVKPGNRRSKSTVSLSPPKTTSTARLASASSPALQTTVPMGSSRPPAAKRTSSSQHKRSSSSSTPPNTTTAVSTASASGTNSPNLRTTQSALALETPPLRSPSSEDGDRLSSLPSYSSEPRSPLQSSPQQGPKPWTRRRKAGFNPVSQYSIRSNHTKLGEIPIEEWSEPWDWRTMDALNREAVAQGWPIVVEGVDLPEAVASRKKRGLWRLFRSG